MSKSKIINLRQSSKLSQKLKHKQQKIVLVGGVFDLLHYGHLKFLQAAKRQADILIVALESDKNVKRKKGKNRPINPEKIRAEILAELKCVDYVLILPEMRTPDYYNLVNKLKPNIIAVTENDPQIDNKRKQAKSVGGKLSIVTPLIPTPSTSQLAKILGLEN